MLPHIPKFPSRQFHFDFTQNHIHHFSLRMPSSPLSSHLSPPLANHPASNAFSNAFFHPRLAETSANQFENFSTIVPKYIFGHPPFASGNHCRPWDRSENPLQSTRARTRSKALRRGREIGRVMGINRSGQRGYKSYESLAQFSFSLFLVSGKVLCSISSQPLSWPFPSSPRHFNIFNKHSALNIPFSYWINIK